MLVQTEDKLVPFQRNAELPEPWTYHSGNHTSSEILPGHPRIKLADEEGLYQFLERELWSAQMDSMTSVLWMMSTQSHTNVSPLHRQKVKGRHIVVTEDPKLHLVWFHDRIFIKPLPTYLCLHRIWTQYVSPIRGSDHRNSRIRAAALGYLRTWFFLIQHESDFRVAQSPELQLVPANISYAEFCDFSAQFDRIEDKDVWARYHFGEIRMTRLNFYAKIFLRRWSFHSMHTQYGDYFARFYGPLLFAFAIISLILSALQVVMSVEQVSLNHWKAFWAISRWSGVLCLLVILVISFGLALLLTVKIAVEWKYALADYARKRTRNVGSVDSSLSPVVPNSCGNSEIEKVQTPPTLQVD